MCLISWQHSQGGRTQHPGSDCERDPQEFQSWTQERKVNKCIRVILIPRWQRALNTEGCSVHNKSHSFNRVPFSCSSEMGEDALELSNCFPFFGWVYPTLPRVLAGWSEKRNITWGLTSCNITFSFRAPNISHKNISDVTTINRSGVVMSLSSADSICLMHPVAGPVAFDSPNGIALVFYAWVVKGGPWRELNLFSPSLVRWLKCSSLASKSGSQRHSKKTQGSSFNLHAVLWVRSSSYPVIHQRISSGWRGEHRFPHASLSVPTYQHSSPLWHKENGCDSQFTGFR